MSGEQGGIVVIGDWWNRAGNTGGRGAHEFPCDEVIDALRRRPNTDVVILDEKWTSKTCSRCVEESGDLDRMDSDVFSARAAMPLALKSIDGKKYLRLFHCAGVGQVNGRMSGGRFCGRIWNRDVNAARNIRNIFLKMMSNGYRRPPVFGTSAQSAPLSAPPVDEPSVEDVDMEGVIDV